MPLKGTKKVVIRLKGRQFAEPREPSELRSWKTRNRDKKGARDVGEGRVYGAEMGDDGKLHLDVQVDAAVGELEARTHQDYAKPIGAAEAVRDDASAQREDAEREIAERDEVEAGLEQEAEELGERRGPNKFVLYLTKFLLFLVSLPIDVEAAHALPLPPGMQTVLAVTIGAGMVVAADWAGRKLEDLHQAHLNRASDPFHFKQQCWLFAASLFFPLVVVVGTTLMRAQAFAAEEKVSEGLVHGGAANVAFAALTLMTFVVALLMSLAYRRALPLREVNAKKKKNRSEREAWQSVADGAERLERQASVTIEWLEQSRERRVEKIRMWGDGRKAGIHHKAATAEVRVRLKDKGPGGGDGAGQPSARPRSPIKPHDQLRAVE